MQKIISLFQRNYETDRKVRNEVVPGAEWVIAGEGVATRKWDGTCCLVRDGKLYKRYDAKKGKTPPAGFEPAQPDPDPNTGHWPGWLPVGAGPEDQWHRFAWSSWLAEGAGIPADGTYELIGKGVQGNVEGMSSTFLMPHGLTKLPGFPRDFDGIKAALADGEIEGVVWHHPDGRMVKIKGKDFGIKRRAVAHA
jgi:hypothetical protein